jgi:thermitase
LVIATIVLVARPPVSSRKGAPAMRRARETITEIQGRARLLLPAILAFTLIGCSTAPIDTRPERPLTAEAEDPKWVVLVEELAPGDSPATVGERYGGEVLVWRKGDYALVGLESEPVAGETAFGLPLDENTKEFTAGGTIARNEGLPTLGNSGVWAEGASTLWAEGVSTLWAEGASTLWAEGGVFELLPENTDIWQQIGLDEAHVLAGRLGGGVKVAVIDTGVDLDHPTLREALAPSREWWDFVDNDAVPQEEGVFGVGGHGHGSNVAGIVRQVAPRATILPIRVLDSDGQGDVVDLAAAIDWAVAMGADIINLSLGADKHVSSVDKALRRAAEDGVFVLSSAGNDDSTDVSFPASRSDTGNPRQRRYIVSVTSVDGGDVKSSFANYGNKLELAAPGEEVFGPAPDELKQMAAWSGTSMAAPMAAGALALALGEALAVDPSDLAVELVRAADAGIYGISGNETFRGQLGAGRLDVHQFLSEVLADQVSR